MMKIQVCGEDQVFVACAGRISRVFPGGRYLGFTFEQLLALGTGEHHVVADKRDLGEKGREPVYDSEWDRDVADFKFTLFMYGVGAYTALEVLWEAERMLDARKASP